MGATFVVTLREAFEAALVLGIVYTYLDKIGGRAYYRYATAGGALGLLASIAAGVAVSFLSGPLLDLGPDVVSAVVVFAAVILLTWHGWWMRQHARSIKGDVQRRIDQARLTRRLWIIGLIAFTGVFREGAETILFLWGLLTQATSSVAGIAGGALGVATAALLGWAIFRGGRRLSLPRFFTVTSAILLFVSAGLFSTGVGQLQGLGVLPQSQALWDTSVLLSDRSLVGAFLSGLLGYRARPSALEVGAYVTYVAVAGLLFFGNVLVPARQRSEPRPDVARP
ncbi:MAG TPA: FTR1 family protein [Methylomirabilota bacterium]|nr:FTR1 family protein [Methylomirabilota bacterium]